MKVAGHNRGGRRPEVLVVVVWQGLAHALEEARSAGGDGTARAGAHITGVQKRRWVVSPGCGVPCFAGVWRTRDTSDESSD